MSDQVPSETPATPATPATPTPITSIDQVPQEIRNQIEAGHRRGLQTKITELTQANQQLSSLYEQSAAFMDLAQANGVQFEEGTELGEVASQVMGTLDSLQTEQQRLTKANEKKAKELGDALKLAENLQTELNSTLTLHSLQAHLGQREDGSPRCVSPKCAELVAAELAKYATVGEDRSITFEMETVDDESGMTQKSQVDAATAVQLLEAKSEWSAFFTATVNSGAGGEQVDGVKRAKDGNIDFDELTKNPAKFMEIMEKNPGLIDAAMKAMG